MSVPVREFMFLCFSCKHFMHRYLSQPNYFLTYMSFIYLEAERPKTIASISVSFGSGFCDDSTDCRKWKV